MRRLFALSLAISTALPALADVAPGDVKVTHGAVAEPLTATAGDPVKGREWFADRKLGNCLACHQNADLGDLPFHGEIGPALDGVADRWSEAELRAIIVNSKAVFGDETIMPAFYRTAGYNRVMPDFEGKTILSAQQVEDVIAYLRTLKQ